MDGDPLSHLPHGLSFRFLDRVLEFSGGDSVVALKNVTADEPFLAGHFPGNPVLPGVLIIEAMAQTAGLLLPPGSMAFLAQVREARFRRPVVPGDQLRLSARRQARLGDIHRFAVRATVEGDLVAEGELDRSSPAVS